jgi:hypothetical protein
VVIWSGGLDSTLLLTHELAHNSVGYVRALTLTGPVQLPKNQVEREKVARREYKAWAKKQGWHLIHQEVSVKTRAQVTAEVGQAGLWLCHLVPYINPADVMLFGYIRGDDFWHFRSFFIDAFNTVVLSHSAQTASVEFPFEWHRKKDIVAGARAYKIPNRCWWTCEKETPRTRACGRCTKCRQVRRAKDDLRDYGTSGPAYRIGPPRLGSLTGGLEKRETMKDDVEERDDAEGIPLAEFLNG